MAITLGFAMHSSFCLIFCLWTENNTNSRKDTPVYRSVDRKDFSGLHAIFVSTEVMRLFMFKIATKIDIIMRHKWDYYTVGFSLFPVLTDFLDTNWNTYQFLPRDARAERGDATVNRPSVRPSVRMSETIRYRVQIGWNSSKIISRPNSLRPLLWLTPKWAIWCNGNTPKIRGE